MRENESTIMTSSKTTTCTKQEIEAIFNTNRFHHRRSTAHVHRSIYKVCKLVATGSSRCGKSSIIQRYLYDTFSENYAPTIEDNYNEEFTVQGINFNLEIVDMCGTNAFPVMRDLAYKTADIVLIVYEINDESSISEASSCYKKIKELRKDKVQIIFVGTKLDLYVNKVTQSVLELTSKNHHALKDANAFHALTSAKWDIGIKPTFEAALDMLFKSNEILAALSLKRKKAIHKTRFCSIL